MIIVSQPSHKNVFMMAGFTWEPCSVQVITQWKEFCDNVLLVLVHDNMVTGIGAGHVVFLLALRPIFKS